VSLRKIIHIDMDAFYASIEQRDNPEYKGKPIAVGGSPEGRGGVVATASYEARKFGVKSAMPSKRAQQLCPQLIFVYPRFEAYKTVSHQLRSIFERYTDLIEPLSLDEAFLDVTQDKQGIGSALDIARLIKDLIHKELNLTASAGVSVNKFVAKIASDLQKPNGLSFIGPSRVAGFIESLPVDKFYGVGKVTAEKMKSMGLFTGADLKKLSEAEMIKRFGKPGAFYYKIVRGIDDRPVVPHREIKSIAAEDTFPYDLTTWEEMTEQLQRITNILYNRLENKSRHGRTITLKIKYHDFKIITRSQSFDHSIKEKKAIFQTATELLAATDLEGKKIRLLGISISNFGDGAPSPTKEKGDDQLSLF
jgi:DNA polymerase IV